MRAQVIFAGQQFMTQYEYSAHVAIHELILASFYKEAICVSNSSKNIIYIFIMDEKGSLKNNKKNALSEMAENAKRFIYNFKMGKEIFSGLQVNEEFLPFQQK
jgi:hypothetical protein